MCDMMNDACSYTSLPSKTDHESRVTKFGASFANLSRHSRKARSASFVIYSTRVTVASPTDNDCLSFVTNRKRLARVRLRFVTNRKRLAIARLRFVTNQQRLLEPCLLTESDCLNPAVPTGNACLIHATLVFQLNLKVICNAVASGLRSF